VLVPFFVRSSHAHFHFSFAFARSPLPTEHTFTDRFSGFLFLCCTNTFCRHIPALLTTSFACVTRLPTAHCGRYAVVWCICQTRAPFGIAIRQIVVHLPPRRVLPLSCGFLLRWLRLFTARVFTLPHTASPFTRFTHCRFRSHGCYRAAPFSAGRTHIPRCVLSRVAVWIHMGRFCYAHALPRSPHVYLSIRVGYHRLFNTAGSFRLVCRCTASRCVYRLRAHTRTFRARTT